jgi:SAM-dependent methyltransferase
MIAPDSTKPHIPQGVVELVRKGIFKCSTKVSGRPKRPIDLAVHPHDQMYLHSLRAHGDLGAALTQYFNVALQQYRCLTQMLQAFGLDHGDRQLLDFACGFGRLLRFLVADFPRETITASEIQSEAVAFVGDEFGVRTVLSTERPSDFVCHTEFDFIWAASLFTHLPEHLFRGWLQKLSELLTPDGVLCFSVRAPAILPAGKVIPETGILFEAESETDDLSTEIYGTTYVTEGYMHSVLQGLPGMSLLRMPRMLANEQDIYVFSRRPLDAALMPKFDRGCWGWLDIKRITATGEVHLEGWAGSLDDGAAPRIEIEINGVAYSLRPSIERPDVVEVFGEARMLMSGWRFQGTMPTGPDDVSVIVTAGGSGSPALIYAGVVRRS